MAELDPVILRFKAENDRYLAELRRTTRSVDEALGLQERKVKALESQMRASSSQIALSIKSIGGALGAYFSAQALTGLLDSFTRLQNELKVAGLEGASLAAVQERLFEVANRNGVAVNSLAELYGKSAQAGREFGASQEQLLGLTEATALALRVSGTDAQQASGAILGLSQALASGTVRAEEFNQMNEGGLRPLLQAAAASDRFGGSVAKLRQEVLAGTLGSRELFDLILKGSEQLRGQAANATLTLSGAFEALNNKLIEYVGGAASASGATGALAQGIGLLADHLDEIIPALTVIATLLGGQMVASLGRMAIGTTSASAAVFALQARMVGAATTAEALTFAMGGLSAALPGLAIGALVLGIGYYVLKAQEAERESAALSASIEQQAVKFGTLGEKISEAEAETGKLNDAQREALTGVANLTGEADKLANAWGRVAASAKAAAIETARAAWVSNASNTLQAKAAYQTKREEIFQGAAKRPFAERGLGADAPAVNAEQALRVTDSAVKETKEYKDWQQSIANTRAAQEALNKLLDQPLTEFRQADAPAAPGKPAKPGRTPRARSGPSADDIALRFADEQDRLTMEALSAQERIATSAKERADLQNQMLDIEREARLREIAANEDYSAQQKAALRAQVEALYGAAAKVDEQGNVITAGLLNRQVAIDELAQLDREAADLADEQYRAQDDALRAQYDLADTQDERRRLALEIFDAEQKYRDEMLQAVIKAHTINGIQDHQARQAQIALDALRNSEGLRRDAVIRQQQGPLGAYADSLTDPKTQVEYAVVRRLQDVDDAISDAVSKQMGVKDPLISDLISILIEQTLIRPMIDNLRKAQGASGGGLLGMVGSVAGAIGSVFGGGGPANLLAGTPYGRASGGYVAPGQTYRVNEGASPGKVEGFMSLNGGHIVPLGRMNAARGGGSTQPAVVRIEVAEGQMFEPRVQQISGDVSVQVVRATSSAIVDASANETVRRLGRPRI
ncbi:tape measure protein [Altericroceibacterium xinjiangense]|uniref:tape measure protein n=1 Tax=Altericroceibacterium xinjiangense TaxID=762261 RepID=UPI000F7E1BCB|nr:tape measure protein [Altericroceibacterium xinjiangense]